MSERSEWFRIRREMFDQVVSEVRARLGPENGELKNYRRSYEADVARRWKPSDRETLFQNLAAARVVLCGDFHALQQSQKAHLRLLQGLFDRGSEKWIIALECVAVRSQKVLDDYLAGRVSEKELKVKLRWVETWGFPWENYRPLFQWAKKRKIRLLALNDPKASMKKRDQVAAKRIVAAAEEFPECRFFVIYGDLHLAPSRLPHELKKKISSVVRVLQNVEGAYFYLLKKGIDHKVDVIRFDRETFALMSVPPWVKWQNYLLWLDQADRELDDDEGADLTDPVAAMVQWIARELKLDLKTDSMTVYTAGDEDLWARVRKTVKASERPWIEMMIEDGRSFYLSSGGWGYLARPSVNHAASLAAQFVHDQACGGSRLSFRMPEDFLRMIWIETVAYFGSKLINPKRKADTLQDIRSSLSGRQGLDDGKEALRLALSQKMTEMMSLSAGTLRWTEIKPQRRSSWIAASSLLGGLAGERLYNGYRRRLINVATLQVLLSKPVGDSHFPLIYQEVLEMIEALPAPFRSKKEKL